MNQGLFAGHLGRDASVRDVNGKVVCNFPLAVTVGWGDRQETLWIDASLWGDRAEKLAPYLTKGKAVTVAGDVGLRQFEKRDGSAGASITVNVQRVTLQSSSDKAAGDARPATGSYDMKAAEAKARAEMPAPRAVATEAELDDDIPFAFAYALPAGLLAWAVFAATAAGRVLA